MPTKNPRINITVTPERYELLKRLAGFQGTTMAGLVSETMELMYPVMERVCVVLEAASRAQESSKEGLRESIAKAEAELLPLLYQAVDQFDLFVDESAKSIGLDFDSEGKASDAIRIAMGEEQPSHPSPRMRSVPPGGGKEATKAGPLRVIRGSGSTDKAKSTKTRRPSK